MKNYFSERFKVHATAKWNDKLNVWKQKKVLDGVLKSCSSGYQSWAKKYKEFSHKEEELQAILE